MSGESGAEGGEEHLANRSRSATPAAERGTGRRAARAAKQTARWSRRENHSNKVVEMGALTRIGHTRYVVLVKELILTAKAFADPTRLRILSALRERELCVCELCDSLAVTQSTLSTHLQVIRDAGLVSSRKQGKWMYYAIEPNAGRLVDALFQFFSRSLKNDATLRQDGKKLKQRLSLRDNGSCCVGFGDAKSCSKKPAK